MMVANIFRVSHFANRFRPRLNHRTTGFTLVEAMIAMSIAALGATSTLTMLTMERVGNSMEQERSRAHQMVSEELERVRLELYPRITAASQVTVWDNGTPNDTSDDTLGTKEVVFKNPETGATLAAAPVPAKRVQVEVTLTWHPRGRLHGKTMHESIVSYIAP